MKVGFIGLGHMGTGMASNLLKAGYELTVWNPALQNVNRLLERERASPILRLTPSGMSTWSSIA